MQTLRALTVGLALHGLTVNGEERPLSFNRDVRPILSDKCFLCHGPDEKNRKADLRLDTRDGATADLGGYKAIAPGNPDESEVLNRVASADSKEVMPPPKSKKVRLNEREIATLRQWIKEGAQYEGHWAFLPLSDTAPPQPNRNGWAKNEIDRFILSRLERDSIQPSPEADRATLLRRVSLDLTGLLPGPDEIRDFLQDQAPNAYEKVVDRLLASPHYGEKWGRHWLDQARYADSNGYSIDGEREQWPYRDWVIKALNDDMPFDQFTVEQIAGDLLPNPTKSQLIATAFHRNTLINQEGGTDKEQFRVEAAMDRVNTTGAVWLGLTVGCAQCHTHKFDPIAQREYYEMLAFFNSGEDVNDKGATLKVAEGEVFGRSVAEPPPQPPPPAEELARRQLEWEKAEEQARLETRAAKANAGGPTKWMPAKYQEYGTESNASFTLLPDNSLLSDQRGSANDTYRIVAQSPAHKIAAIRLRVLTHESLPKYGPGLAANGNFLLTDFRVSLDGAERPIAKASADHEQADFPVGGAVDEDPQSGWAINAGKGESGKMNANHEAVFVFGESLETEGKAVEIKMRYDRNKNYLIGRFAIEFAETAPTADEKEQVLLAALRIPAAQRNAVQKKAVADAFAASESKKAAAQRPPARTAELMIMRDLEKPRDSFLLTRGDFTRPDQKLGKLQPGIIKAIAPALRTASTPTRLDLARWLVHSDNPLTPRVAMNRVWMRYFGRGIVETDEDFGAQGSPPTHPELLDWLGREFIRRGWSLKAMHRLIVTSATYRQSSKARPDLAEKDPRNLLLARQERLRFDAEAVRDAALCASGLLNPAIGGPSVKPPQPDGVYAFTQTAKKWNADTGSNRFRRALYTMYYRSAPYPLFTTFDAPDFQTVCTRRNRSNTPLQSLTLANDPAFFEIAQSFAGRLAVEVPAGSNAIRERIHRGAILALSREPTPAETETLAAFTAAQTQSFINDTDAAHAIAPKQAAKAGLSEAEGAALVCLARVLINTDNFITRE